jgi:MurNAc alpha-1-phosphate uridylyltransferase
VDVASLALPDDSLAHLVMVPNPAHNPAGDFRLERGRLRPLDGGRGEPLTYSGIALFRPELFAQQSPGRFPLAPLLVRAIADGRASGVRHDGAWDDIGTPERLAALRARLARPAAPAR